MPPMFRLDPYAPCVHEPGGVYCAVELTLVADENNPLMTMIQEYSARREMHFNHSRLHRGICVTKTCKEYLSQNTSADLRLVLEGCLNDSLWAEYKLKSKLSSEVLCNDLDNKMDIDFGDIAVAVICLSILLLHVVGNLYDFFFVPNKDRKGNKLLLCFSIKRNWKRLVAPPALGPETRLKRLKGLLICCNVTAFPGGDVSEQESEVFCGCCACSSLLGSSLGGVEAGGEMHDIRALA
ncbi:PREDICTED: uncharacterized protein LOC106114006 [Papilio xuthus]|uniref:Uncharacterized protein LOC106114006 n=1 Tax=Papilio xuthus TaxID=66420 RepID=A0AAJ6Z0A3_PAPXU|nr:PREDICTED: uncharacterized protein LOC106114006 [Papilio xuthus]